MSRPEPALIVAEARRWIGTPFMHLGRRRGIGCDCAGLIIGVAHGLGLSRFEFTAYPPDPAGIDMTEMLAANMDAIAVEGAGPGDVAHIRWFSAPRHLAIIADRDQNDGALDMIHAYAPAGKVREHILDAKWRRRVIGTWRYREAG